jgi:hypothetical protein
MCVIFTDSRDGTDKWVAFPKVHCSHDVPSTYKWQVFVKYTTHGKASLFSFALRQLPSQRSWKRKTTVTSYTFHNALFFRCCQHKNGIWLCLAIEQSLLTETLRTAAVEGHLTFCLEGVGFCVWDSEQYSLLTWHRAIWARTRDTRKNNLRHQTSPPTLTRDIQLYIPLSLVYNLPRLFSFI